MRRDTLSGIALIVGAALFLLTMALHPTSGSLEGLVREGRIRVLSHSLGLASIPISLFGFMGLTRRLGSGGEVWPVGALLLYGFGAVAALSAAVLNGLAAPAFAAYVAGSPEAQDTARTVLRYAFLLNSSFAKVFMAATAAALVLWSVAIIRTRAFPSWTGWLGVVFGVAGLLAVLGGFLGTSVHEFALFVLGFTVWTIAIGVLLTQAGTVESVPRGF
jgi:hypothetical protein